MNLPAINLTGDALTRFDSALRKEWLVTNGLGGYAASTVLGINTRKYHGLLVAALHPPTDRTVCLAKLDEEVLVNNNSYLLGTNEFHDKIFPQGYISLKAFWLNPLPQYIYKIQNVEVKKTIIMPKGKNAVVVAYKIQNRNPFEAKIRVFPLITCRHFHSVVDRWKRQLDFSQRQEDQTVELTFNTQKVMVTAFATKGEFKRQKTWIERLHYREEAKRGESNTDDCFRPGYFEVPVSPKLIEEFSIITTVKKRIKSSRKNLCIINNATNNVKSESKSELEHREKLLVNFYNSHKISSSDWLNWILLATDTFITEYNNGRRSIIAGYFWFENWGRDTFVSLPGFLLATSRFKDARKILADFICYIKHGLIPNFIQDRSGEPAYNAADATLWYINAVLQYLKYTGDFRFIRKKLWDNLKAVVESHEKGTDFNIRLDNDGLLAHGSQLTWMDAEVKGEAVTPRGGKAVEIQALWYNALKTMQLLANRFEEKSLAEKYFKMTLETKASFNDKFWNNETGCLYDVVGVSGVDSSLRPNQLIGVALDFTMLDNDRHEQVVDAVAKELLTPCGLRTLSRGNPKYKGRYIGDRLSRDNAYHNGTVWPWLLGPFTTAVYKVGDQGNLRHKYSLKNFLLHFFTKQIFEAGLGNISEIFDGEPPYTPRGCIAQAWSVAEPLRAYLEDIMEIRPKYEKEVLQT